MIRLLFKIITIDSYYFDFDCSEAKEILKESGGKLMKSEHLLEAHKRLGLNDQADILNQYMNKYNTVVSFDENQKWKI